MTDELVRARAGDQQAFESLVEPHRRELLAHSYRMLGSLADAEDALQDALVRAWSGLGGFEARSSLRTWLFRITTHVCLSAAERRGRRILPDDVRPAAEPDEPWQPPADAAYIVPLPDDRLVAKESVALAFVAALQRLSPNQRAALLLFDVLDFRASEVAELLETSEAAAYSALQRARETMREPARRPPADIDRSLLERYLRAWEEADVPALVALLAEDARMSMPPFPLWYRGAQAIGAALGAMVLPASARGQFRGLPTGANGQPAIALYAREPDGRYLPQSLHVLRIADGRIAEIVAFMGGSALQGFALPVVL